MRFSQAVGVEDILAVDLSEGMLRVLRQRNTDPGSLGNHPGVRSGQLSGQADNGLRGCLHDYGCHIILLRPALTYSGTYY